MLNSYKTIIRKPKTGLLGDGTSSIAMTTSTVSKLSRPRSFEKCDLFVILFVGHFKLRYQHQVEIPYLRRILDLKQSY